MPNIHKLRRCSERQPNIYDIIIIIYNKYNINNKRWYKNKKDSNENMKQKK